MPTFEELRKEAQKQVIITNKDEFCGVVSEVINSEPHSILFEKQPLLMVAFMTVAFDICDHLIELTQQRTNAVAEEKKVEE